MLTVVLKSFNQPINKRPKYYDGDISGWSLDLLTHNSEQLNGYLDFENSAPDTKELESFLKSELEMIGIPFLKSLLTKQGVKEMIEKIERLRFHCTKRLLEELIK
jgi:hypothetical protein